MYVEYSYYVTDYGGEMPEEEYTAYEKKAEAYIRSITYINGNIFDEKSDDVKAAVCAVSDVYYREDKKRKGNGLVKSENNDGYSVTYVTEQTDGQTAEELIKKKAYDAAYTYLLPIGWLSRRVGRKKDADKCRHYTL